MVAQEILLFAHGHLQPGDDLVLEATMNTWAVVRLLQPHVASVSVANPLKVKYIAEAHVKTDKIDAEVLAQLLRSNYLRQSATKCYQGSITKAGNSQARWMLVEAAQSVSRHPGPLGHFFRKLARKKNRNVAIVATARKLVTIAIEMLKRREPYRYAVPKSTAEKLASLRVRATGERRRGGTAKGAKRQPARLLGGARGVKPLSEVYESEGLPGTAGATGQPRGSGVRRFLGREIPVRRHS